ncbi:MAG: WD40 repeat domain-containing protein [Planctomycetaceae bacterium]|jgi:WD40 repeat protein|nr:WD40 repeat domain-containing protein [Planctomycetaceae bacterium]MBT6485067.1 WD40 repeat domain-containing protein [Planctomycetaceae bacterium]MBT6496967.1 WD40 repeat domain-containing protein [Planctomycetaceae bacterium]
MNQEKTAAAAKPAATPLDAKQAHVKATWKHGSPLIACRYDPKGRFLFTSGEDYSLQRWDLATGKPTVWAAHESWIRDIAFMADGETAISVGCDDKMIFWATAAEKPTPLKTIEAHKGWIRAVEVSPDGKMIATGGNDNLVKLWNADGSLQKELTGHDSNVYSIFFHPGGEFLLSGDLAGKVHQWELSTGKLVRTFDAKDLHTYNGGQKVHYGGVRSIALSPDGKHLACCGLHKATNPLGAVNEPLVMLFEWESGKKVRSQVAAGVKGILWQVNWLADGTLAAASGGSGGGFLIFWKTGADKEFHKLKLPNTARDADLHPNGLELATVHHDRQVRITRLTAKPTPDKPKPKK